MTDLRTRDEIDPSSRGRRGAHRAAPSRLAVLLPVAVVVAVVVLTVLALVFFTGLGGRGAAGEQVSASAPATTPTTAPPTTAPTAPSEPTSAPGTSDPAASDGDGAPTGEPGSQAPGVDERGADDGAQPPPGGDGEDADARGAPVVVLNATRTSGIAAKTAEELKGEGWTVSRTGDADGSVDATRVRYSDPALESAAQAVAASLGGAAVERDEGVEQGVVTVVAGPDRVGR